MKTFLIAFAFVFSAFSAAATTCAGATVIPAGTTLPSTLTLTCGTTNDITALNTSCGSTLYHNGNEAVFSWTPSAAVVSLKMTYTGVANSGIFLYQGCPTSGGICLANITSAAATKVLTYGGTLSAGTTYYIVIDVSTPGGSPCPGTLVLAKPGNTVCANPSPICTGTPINFTANSGSPAATTLNPGNNYGCLLTSPNPSWYYLKIATGGNLVVDITAGSDVDYAMWGPYSTLAAGQAQCNAYGAPISCSYSTSATEHAIINGVIAGQVYILLVTNYANTVQTININQSPSNTATTDCSIVSLPVDLSSWDAEYEDGKVNLTWTTEHETGNRLFRIQRSAYGYTWETIGVKEGASTTTQQTHYAFTDNFPLNGVSYYRLQQLDGDGQISYTPVRSVTSEPGTDVTLYPNPVTKYLSVHQGKTRITGLSVIDLVGRKRKIESSTTSGGYTIDCQNLEAGIYFVEYTVNGKKMSRKFTVVSQNEL